MRNVIEMALKSLFFLQIHKNHPASEVSASLCDALELHQFVQNGATLDNFCAKNLAFGLSPFPLSQILVTLMVAFTVADRFFKVIISAGYETS